MFIGCVDFSPYTSVGFYPESEGVFSMSHRIFCIEEEVTKHDKA